MKKLIVCLCIMASLLSVSGCGKKDGGGGEGPQTPVGDETLFVINGLEFHFDKETSFKDLKYTITEGFREIEWDRYIQYDYLQEDEKNLLYFRIFYYKGLDDAAAIGDLGLDKNITFTEGSTENIEYRLYDENRDDGTVHLYFISHEGDTYVLNFASRYDIKDFEERLLKTISF